MDRIDEEPRPKTLNNASVSELEDEIDKKLGPRRERSESTSKVEVFFVPVPVAVSGCACDLYYTYLRHRYPSY